jgi:hypothetical protein
MIPPRPGEVVEVLVVEGLGLWVVELGIGELVVGTDGSKSDLED